MKKIIATLSLIGVLLVSGTPAKTGYSISDFQGSQSRQSCKETSIKTNTDWGIFVTALTGIFVTAFTGTIYIGGFTKGEDKTKTSANCRS